MEMLVTRLQSTVYRCTTMSKVVALATLLLVAVIGSCNAALPLPSYIKPCATSDPNFNECAVQSARNALPFILDGDKKYRVPSLNPLSIDEVKIENGPQQSGLTFTVKNVKVYGIPDVKILSTEFDFQKKHVRHTFQMDSARIEGDYNVDGRILLLPIKGEGFCNLTISDVVVKFQHDFEKVKREDGKEYMDIRDAHSDVTVSKMYIHLTNLFNGNKALTDQMNTFLNENWKDVYQEVSPAVIETFNTVATNIVTNMAEVVPYDKAFPYKIE